MTAVTAALVVVWVPSGGVGVAPGMGSAQVLQKELEDRSFDPQPAQYEFPGSLTVCPSSRQCVRTLRGA